MTMTMRPTVYFPSERIRVDYAWSFTEAPMVETSSNASSDTLSVILDVPGYHVVRPIPYHVESIGEQIVAVDDEFDRYGAGTSLVQAKLELACQLSDYFNTLKEDCEILAKTAMRDYRRMAHFVSWIAE